MPISVSVQKDLKLGQCLDVDDMTSPSKFGEVLWPSSDFVDRSVFYSPAISRLFCKIANLWDVDLKFSGIISDVNMDKTAKFCEVSMPWSNIFLNLDFRNFCQ